MHERRGRGVGGVLVSYLHHLPTGGSQSSHLVEFLKNSILCPVNSCEHVRCACFAVWRAHLESAMWRVHCGRAQSPVLKKRRSFRLKLIKKPDNLQSSGKLLYLSSSSATCFHKPTGKLHSSLPVHQDYFLLWAYEHINQGGCMPVCFESLVNESWCE